MEFYINSGNNFFIREREYGWENHPISILRPIGSQRGWSKKRYPLYKGFERHQSIWTDEEFQGYVNSGKDGAREVSQEEFDNLLYMHELIS